MIPPPAAAKLRALHIHQDRIFRPPQHPEQKKCRMPPSQLEQPSTHLTHTQLPKRPTTQPPNHPAHIQSEGGKVFHGVNLALIEQRIRIRIRNRIPRSLDSPVLSNRFSVLGVGWLDGWMDG